MKEQNCYVAPDYGEELKKFQHDAEFASQHLRVYQLPYTPNVEKVLTPDQLLKRQEQRREQGLRSKKMQEEKRKEKVLLLFFSSLL